MGLRKAAYAATYLRDTASEWYHAIKAANNDRLDQWTNNNDNRNLKRQLVDRFTSEENQRRKFNELLHMVQGKGESVQTYAEDLRKS
jgi:Retrotransposon gag protein.